MKVVSIVRYVRGGSWEGNVVGKGRRRKEHSGDENCRWTGELEYWGFGELKEASVSGVQCGRREGHEWDVMGTPEQMWQVQKFKVVLLTFFLWMVFMERRFPAFPCLYHQFKRYWNGCLRNHLDHIRWKIPDVPSFCRAGHEQMPTWVSCPTWQEW